MTRLPSSSQVTDQGLAANKLPGPASASSTSLSRCSILGWGSTVPKRSLVGQRLSGRDGPLLIIRVDGSLATESGPCPRAQEDHVLASSWTTLTRWKVLGIQTITMCAKVTQAHHAPRLPWLPHQGILVPERTNSGNYRTALSKHARPRGPTLDYSTCTLDLFDLWVHGHTTYLNQDSSLFRSQCTPPPASRGPVVCKRVWLPPLGKEPRITRRVIRDSIL